MRRICSITFLLCSVIGNAQNYQCLQTGVKHYFINQGGYLRGIRIDSAKTFADSIVYYPYHTPRGRYLQNPALDSTGGSWLGKRVLQLNDGTFLFDNIWNDTVVIKTQAHAGDNWIFYNDTTKLFYQAEVLTEDTMTVLGSVDSIKRILITARNTAGIVTTDPANGFQVILSKNNGFVQAFDLYTFPYHAPDSGYISGIDYYTDVLVSRYTGVPDWTFTLINFVVPIVKDLYQWNVGDVYEYSTCNGSFEHYGSGCNPVEHYFIDTVVSVVTTSTSVNYTITGKQYDYVYPVVDPRSLPFAGYYSERKITGVATYSAIPVFDTSLMPEEYNQQYFYKYLPNDSSACVLSKLYAMAHNDYINKAWYSEPFEAGTGPTVYKYPLGQVSYLSAAVETDGSVVNSLDLLYYYRSGISCGQIKYPALLNAISLEVASGTVKLFPNPVTNELTISANGKIKEATISNPWGQILYTHDYSSNNVTIDVSDLPAGVYLIRINKTEIRKFIKL